ncbi:hypothetical protein ANCCAN_24527 [Ancylostoma caninum]|uniref:Uncharacterized protein n=1 Tax=Ancylostoma caninum TaxID=29170 RepID=A0A368FFQ5_ANCCA|nr:hypothetical protein ANCCAN_24527 [Ancylostoma caninum]
MRKQPAPLPPAPKFKTLVSRAIRTGALERIKSESEDETNCSEKRESQVKQDGNQVK